ncbi:MAG: permease [Gammaproteobacteria bacterium]|nr:MAG: permease [Gammaproteobacteria bacterium]
MLTNTLNILLEVAPFLLLGLIISGLIKSYASDALIKKHLSGTGIKPVVKASFIGAPLPLCSCGVIPVALGLRKQGASKGATASFMIATPETGVDSISVSFALLGPFMAIVRPIAALISSITAGVLVDTFADVDNNDPSNTQSKPSEAPKSSCSSNLKSIPESSGLERFWDGQKYSFTTLYDNTFKWLFIGIIAAGAILTYVPPDYFSELGHSYLGMLLVMAISIPMYTCATASTPIAAGLIAMGVSPGAALVFLLAGPATNIATLGVINSQLGKRAMVAYLSAIGFCALGFGILTDFISSEFGISVINDPHDHEHLVPHFIAWATLTVLIISQKHIRQIWLAPFSLKPKGAAKPATKNCCDQKPQSEQSKTSCCSSKKEEERPKSCCCGSKRSN